MVKRDKNNEWELVDGGNAGLVADDSFACIMTMDITSKTRGRNKESEVCVYKVKDGKIVMERFI